MALLCVWCPLMNWEKGNLHWERGILHRECHFWGTVDILWNWRYKSFPSTGRGEQVHGCWVHLRPQVGHSLSLIKTVVFQSCCRRCHGNKEKNSIEDGDFSLISCLTFHAAFLTEDIHIFLKHLNVKRHRGVAGVLQLCSILPHWPQHVFTSPPDHPRRSLDLLVHSHTQTVPIVAPTPLCPAGAAPAATTISNIFL